MQTKIHRNIPPVHRPALRASIADHYQVHGTATDGGAAYARAAYPLLPMSGDLNVPET